MDNNKYKGRKGQKLLRELNQKSEQLIAQCDEYAMSLSETELILRSIPDPEDRIYFLEILGRLDRFWNSIKTVGFLKLSQAWIRRKKLTELNKQDVEDMLVEILPSEEMQEVRAMRISSDRQER